MKRKEFIIVAIILLVAFAGITIFKKMGNDTVNISSNTPTKSDSLQRFWDYYKLATQYRLEEKTDSSINTYQQAIRLNPYHEDALYYVGTMYMKAGDFEKAQKSWEKLIELNQGSERACIQLGNLYFCMDHKNYFHPQKAKLYFERANELNKESLNPNLRLGEIALFQNRTGDAFAIFSKLLIMDQKNVEISFLNGYLYWKSGKEQDAIKDLERTFELGPPTISNSEEGNSAKKEKISKSQDCDLFLFWLNGNLKEKEKNDIRIAMPQVYKKFDQYLISMREHLNHD